MKLFEFPKVMKTEEMPRQKNKKMDFRESKRAKHTKH